MSGSIETGSEIVAAVMKGAHTRKDIARVSGASENALDHWLAGLHASGVLYRRKGAPNGSRWPVEYHMQPTPFALADEV